MSAALRIEPARKRPAFRLAVKESSPAHTIAILEAAEARQRLQSLLFALEVAGVDVQLRQVVRDAIDDIAAIVGSLAQ